MEKVLLIIDDSKEIVDIVQEILGDLFDRVVSAGNVDDAITCLGNEQYSFMLLDINLEGRNGGEIVKYLAEHPQNLNTKCPIVILSGIVNTQFVEKLGNRFAGVVMKPFDHVDLYNLAKTIVYPEEISEVPQEVKSQEEFLDVKCELPFPIPEMEEKVSKIVDQIKKNTRLKQIFADMKVNRNADNFLATHAMMTINISTAICLKMEWSTEKTLEKYVYASYLHDMALANRPDLARFNGTLEELEAMRSHMPHSDYKLIFDHASIAAKTIDEIEEIPQDVGIMVRQHHECPKSPGFPGKLGFSKITPLSTVFIVAHDMTHYIIDTPNWSVKDYIEKARLKFKGPHFNKALSALNDMN